MALLIRPERHRDFLQLLQNSFRLRRRVFVDGLQWNLPIDGDQEVDQFDGPAAVYLLALGPRGEVRATVRMIPSEKPNVSCDVLGPQMGLSLPRGPHIVEMSRMCADPALSKDERRAAMMDLRASIAMMFLRQGWTHSVGVGYDHHIQPFIRSGMTVEFLGPPAIFPGDRRLSFAILANDPDRPARLADWLAAGAVGLQDPDQDPMLLLRYGDRAAAAA